MEEARSKARWLSNVVDSKSKRKLTTSAVQGSNAEDVGGTALCVGVKACRAGIAAPTATTWHGEGNCHAGED